MLLSTFLWFLTLYSWQPRTWTRSILSAITASERVHTRNLNASVRDLCGRRDCERNISAIVAMKNDLEFLTKYVHMKWSQETTTNAAHFVCIFFKKLIVKKCEKLILLNAQPWKSSLN